MINISKKGISVQQAERIRQNQGLHATKLEKLRVSKNLSQSQLSKKSNVSIRVIQNYEQRIKSIDGAKFTTLVDLCLGLECRFEDILEDETNINKINRLFEINEERKYSESDIILNDHDKELYKYFFDNDEISDLTEDQRNGIKYVLLDFPKRWINILELRYKKEFTLNQIKKDQGISAERVRQIIIEAINELELLKDSEYVVYGFQGWHKKSITDEINRNIFEIPISELNLSGRAYNCLMRAGITTIGQLKELSDVDLLSIKNLGKTVASEIMKKTHEYN